MSLSSQQRRTNDDDISLPSSKRLKSTGLDFILRQLEYTKDSMVTNDELHKSIEVCPVMKVLVDTEVFQRLRYINQLGNAQYIYSCADHNRFQHSLGVAHLAEKMCKSIKEEQPELGATYKDVLCVKLAGLLHDIGHGPMSHLYESFRFNYLPKYLEANPHLKKEYNAWEYQKVPSKWAHEDSSIMFIDAALEELGLQIDLNNLDKPLRQIGHGIDANSIRAFKPLRGLKPHEIQERVLTSRDFIFIKECIMGAPLEGTNDFVGRQDKKLEWLYDIVSNRHTGLDVDKIDYFARDEGRAIDKCGIEMKMITDARVARARCSRPDKCHVCKREFQPGMHYMICYPEKHIAASANFFKKRFHLHNIVYQHKTTSAVESMICDILCRADPYLRLQSYSGETFPISRACFKSDFLLRLDDTILTLIAHSTDERLKEARELYRRFKRHDFYKCAVDHSLDIDQLIVDDEDLEGEELKKVEESRRDKSVWEMEENEIETGMLEEIRIWGNEEQNICSDSVTNLKANDFVVNKFCMHHGSGNKNPLLRMRFYDKMNEEKICGPIDGLPMAEQIQESKHSSILPRAFQKVGIRVLVRDDSKRGIVNQLFHQWFERESERIKNGDLPQQCGQGIHIYGANLHNMDGNDGDGNMDENDHDDNHHEQNPPPVFLSQDSDDDQADDYNDDDFIEQQQQDLSPVPVARMRSHG